VNRNALAHVRRVLELRLPGHLTLAALDDALKVLDTELARVPAATPVGLLIDAHEMSGYDADARARFVEWNGKVREKVLRVAIITERLLWHMVVAAMSVASRQTMRAFDRSDEGRRWLSGN